MKAFQSKPIKPTLLITPIVKIKMDMLISKSKEEIAWHGFVKKIQPNVYSWYDIIMYPQYVTGATVTPDDDEYTQWLLKQMEFENFNDMRLHGHSHVYMSCTPSGVDNKFRRDILINLKEDDFYIFLIANKKGTWNIELYDNSQKICFETSDIDVYVASDKDINRANEWTDKAIKNNIKEKECSITSNQKNFLTRTHAKKPSTSSEAEQLEEAWRNSLQDWE